MEQNKTGKYLKYAIGEIMLVVIGILIALQINNWNENQKVNKKEVLVLHEILNSINKDLDNYDKFFTPRLTKKENGLDSLITYIFDNKPIEDSLFIDFYTDVGQDVFLRFDNGPFEALKSSGLEIIRNDSLRTAINNAYTTELPIYTYFGNERVEVSKLEISKMEKKFLKLKRVYHDDGRKHLHFDLKVDDILNNQDFLWILYLERLKNSEFKNRIRQTKNTLNRIKEMIGKELEK